MNKTYFISLLFLTITLAFVSDAKAADAVLECHNCATYQYKQKAYQVIPSNAYQGNYDVYVLDVINNQIKRYSIFLETDPAFPTGVSKIAIETSPESSYVNKFNNLVESYNDLKNTVNNQKTDYPDGSAFELRGGRNTQMETAISDYLYSSSNIATRAAMYIDAAVLVLGQIANISVVEVVTFPDGSSIEVKLVGMYDGIVFEYVDGSAKDANGNSIPDSGSDFSGYYGEFTTHDDSLAQWLQWAEMNGIPITYGGSGNRVKVYCYNEPGGTVCVYERLQY